MMTYKMKLHDTLSVINKQISLTVVPSAFTFENSSSYSRTFKMLDRDNLKDLIVGFSLVSKMSTKH